MAFPILGQVGALESIVNEDMWTSMPFCEANSKPGQSPAYPSGCVWGGGHPCLSVGNEMGLVLYPVRVQGFFYVQGPLA